MIFTITTLNLPYILMALYTLNIILSMLTDNVLFDALDILFVPTLAVSFYLLSWPFTSGLFTFLFIAQIFKMAMYIKNK